MVNEMVRVKLVDIFKKNWRVKMRKKCMVHGLEYAWRVPNAVKTQQRRNGPPSLNWVINRGPARGQGTPL
jgi:hypothetical protein